MTEKVKVRTTMRPDEELEVTEAERLDLDRQGLLLRDKKDRATARSEEKR